MLNVVDVGASVGKFASYIAASKLNVNVVAIEPIPDIAAEIPKAANLTIVNKALCAAEKIPKNGKRKFNRMVWSELSTFNDVNADLDKDLWVHHLPGLEVSTEIEVECCTLETLLMDLRIAAIDFLKIDTQGSDLEVFLSAGDFLPKISSAVLEFPYTKDSSLYEEEPDIIQAIQRLSDVNFFPVRIVPNGAGECNLFVRNGSFSVESYFQLEKMLELEIAPTLKIGDYHPYQRLSFLGLFLVKTKILIKHKLLKL